MSKYRIEVVPSRYKVAIQLLFWGVILISPFHWQSNIVPFQWGIHVLFSLLIVGLAIKNLREHARLQVILVGLSSEGEWEYLNGESQTHWRISAKSRVSQWFLWIHLVSSVNPQKSHWYVIFKDQVSESDYRRLCRAILLQQNLS